MLYLHFPNFSVETKKLNLFFESGSFVLKSLIDVQTITRNDILVYVFNVSCSVLSSNLMKFQWSSGFLSVF